MGSVVSSSDELLPGGVARPDVGVPDAGVPDTPVDFDAWVTANGTALLRFAYAVVGEREAAEDAVQTSLARAYERWPRISRVDDLPAYVRRMILNAHVSWWRRIPRRERSVDGFGMIDLTGPDVGEQVTRSELIWECCKDLPPRQRAAIVLRFYEDLTYAQIAAVLGCAEATARSHVHRGLVALRLAIEDEEDRDE
jgi:RNA polymerase sigma-70 factor (sigma-E family)